MALQTFTAGQVLTAAQVNALQANDYNQTVSTKTDSYTLVAADKGTRVVMNKATATTITVNTSLFSAGDTLFIQNIGAGVCTITAGTATVSTAGSLALPQNAGGTLYFTSAGVSIFFPTVAISGTSGLVLINTTTLSAVSSQSFNDVFSATYNNYYIQMSLDGSTTAQDVNFRLRVASVDNSSANYNRSALFQSSTTVTGQLLTAQTSWAGVGGAISTQRQYSDLTVFNPFATQITGAIGNGQELPSGNITQYRRMFGTTVTTSYTGFTIFPVSGTMSGTVSVYGYNI